MVASRLSGTVAGVHTQGTWHLFAAQMQGGCNLNKWGTNSAVIRAEATDALGPFEFKEVVTPVFTHNPTVRRAPDGTVLLFTLGEGTGRKPENCTGAPATGGGRERGPTPSPPLRQQRSQPASKGAAAVYNTSTFIWHSRSVYGPWQRIPLAIQPSPRGPNCSFYVSNPSPVIHRNGSVTIAVESGWCDGLEVVVILTAPTWRGPYTPLTGAPALEKPPLCLSKAQFEDPCLWETDRGFHMIVHGMCPSGIFNARYAYSEDGRNWTLTEGQTYSYAVPFDDGKEELFARMERPQILFVGNSSDGFAPYGSGQPTALFNGVQPLSPTTLLGMSFTLARPLAVNADLSG